MPELMTLELCPQIGAYGGSVPFRHPKPHSPDDWDAMFHAAFTYACLLAPGLRREAGVLILSEHGQRLGRVWQDGRITW